MSAPTKDSLEKLTKERDDVIAKLLSFDIFWTNYKKSDAIGTLQKRFDESVPLIDAFEKVQFRIMNLVAGTIHEAVYDQFAEMNFEQTYYNLIGFVRSYLKRLRLPELLEQRSRICVALERFEIVANYREGIQIHALRERLDRSVRLLQELKEVQSSIMNIIAGTPEEAIYGRYGGNFKNIHKVIATVRSYLEDAENAFIPRISMALLKNEATLEIN